MEEIIATLKEIFNKLINRDDIVITAETTAHDVDGWDSITNMLLLNEVEKTYHIKFTFREIAHMRNVGELCSKIMEKTGNNS